MSRFLIPLGAAFAALFFCLPTMAQGQSFSRAIVSSGATVGTGASTVGNAHQRAYLALLNQSASNTLYCTVDGSTPAASATANQITIPPLSGYVWSGPGLIPSNAIQCIASGSGTPMTILE